MLKSPEKTTILQARSKQDRIYVNIFNAMRTNTNRFKAQEVKANSINTIKLASQQPVSPYPLLNIPIMKYNFIAKAF